MKIIPKHIAAYVGVAALSAAGLLGAVSSAQKPAVRHKFMNEIETVLSMTPAQREQTQAALQSARESSMPVRQELRNTRKSLESAIRSDNTAQIQQLSTTEGQEIGHLMAIRSAAFAKIYRTLTPDQKQKADALHSLFMTGMRGHMHHAGRHTAS